MPKSKTFVDLTPSRKPKYESKRYYTSLILFLNILSFIVIACIFYTSELLLFEQGKEYAYIEMLDRWGMSR